MLKNICERLLLLTMKKERNSTDRTTHLKQTKRSLIENWESEK